MWKKFQLDTSYYAGDMGVKQFFFCRKLDFEKTGGYRRFSQKKEDMSTILIINLQRKNHQKIIT
jgi:hypothetical protein